MDSIVPQGYKQTKVGVIPEDWEVVKLSEVCSKKAKYGINAPAVQFNINLPVYLRITDISERGEFNPKKISSVSDKDYKNFILAENELVLAKTGATVGKSYLYNKNDGELIYAGFLIKISPDIAKLNSKFLKNYLATSFYWYWVKVMSVRSGQPGINAEEYSIMPIPLPALEEQEKIANILTTWNDAISKQKELIKAKEALKKGLMQKLLSEEVRFNGFFNEWEEVRLGEILKIGSGKDYKHLENGDIPVYGTGGYMLSVNNYLYDGESVCIGRKGTIDKPMLLNGKFWTVDTLFYTHSYKKSIPIFLYFTFLQINWKKYNEASGIPSLSKKIIETITIKLPSLQEQQKIAEVLINADKEIDLLKNELQKLKEQKKGLMQKLLTGVVRVKV